MKNVYILQNSLLSFDMDIAHIYSNELYNLYLITNEFGLVRLKERNQVNYFKEIWKANDFTFEKIKEIILKNQIKNPSPLQIVTNAEEAVSLCGKLQVFFKIEKNNYERFINKLLMKKLLRSSKDIFVPKYIIYDPDKFSNSPDKYLKSIIKKLNFPMIAKPIDSMSCKDVTKIDSKEDLINWCSKNTSQSTTYEIDQFIEGHVFNCDSYIQNHKIVFTQVTTTSNSCYDFLCGLTKGTMSLPHNHNDYKLFNKFTAKLHKAIGIPRAGVTHLELIKTSDHKIFFIEIAYRSPGILIPAMYKKFLNVDTIESHILLQINNKFKFEIKKGPYCAWAAFPTRKGFLKEIYIPQISSEFTLNWKYKPGDAMPEPLAGRDYAGCILLWNNDYFQLKKDFDYINQYNFFNIDEYN